MLQQFKGLDKGSGTVAKIGAKAGRFNNSRLAKTRRAAVVEN
jgi:hypothetical protein